MYMYIDMFFSVEDRTLFRRVSIKRYICTRDAATIEYFPTYVHEMK